MLRISIIIFLFFSISRNSFSQWWYTINFESNDDSVIKIDTTNPSNIWQIGKPQKTFFDSAYSKPNAIVTDTINFYSVNNISSFVLKIYDSNWLSWPPDIIISFMHKYDTDTLKDGGIVEISFDDGNNWTNIINPSNVGNNLYNVNDTILGGLQALSGKSSWRPGSIGICNIPTNPDSILLKFIFKSDSIQNSKEGWLIDNIQMDYVVDLCGTHINEHSEKNSFVSISPNPFSDNSILEFKNRNDEMSEIDIYNSIGAKISKCKNISENKLQLNRNNFTEGLYFYKVKTKKGYSESGKFVVQ